MTIMDYSKLFYSLFSTSIENLRHLGCWEQTLLFQHFTTDEAKVGFNLIKTTGLIRELDQFRVDTVVDNLYVSEGGDCVSPSLVAGCIKSSNKEVFLGTPAPITKNIHGDFERSYLNAERACSGFSLVDATKITVSNGVLSAHFGYSALPYRELSFGEKYFLPDGSSSDSFGGFDDALLSELFAEISRSNRNLFFICTYVPLEKAKCQISTSFGITSPSEIAFISLKELGSDLEKYKVILSKRSTKVIVIDDFLDSISLYSELRKIIDFDLLSMSIGGLWSYRCAPKVCDNCSTESPTDDLKFVEHGVSFKSGNPRLKGGGCKKCKYGYIGVDWIRENISGQSVEHFVQAISSFEQKKALTPSTKMIDLISFYSEKKSHVSFFQALEKKVALGVISVDDAKLLLL